jgi:hypothetical protein
VEERVEGVGLELLLFCLLPTLSGANGEGSL